MDHTIDSVDPDKVFDQKLALLDQLLDQAGISTGSAPDVTIPPRTINEQLPLSFAQQRLWLTEQLQSQSAYVIPAAIHMKGQLNLFALEQSLNEIVDRHEILRTTFTVANSQPVQIVHPKMVIPLVIQDLQHLCATADDMHVQQHMRSESLRPFDITHGPLLRTTVMRLSKSEHILLVVVHHIVFDGWSTALFLKELAALYTAFSNKKPSPLAALPIQYADYAVWQRQQSNHDTIDQQLPYWQQQLANAPTTLTLPTDRTRPAVQRSCGATRHFALPDKLSQALQTFSNQEETTLFTTLLTVFKILVYRYTGQPDIVVGTPVANRTILETEELIGFFVNTLVLRTDLHHNPPLREALQRVRQVTFDAFTHQEVPFERVVEALQVDRSLGHNPLFQIMFALQDVAYDSFTFPAMSIDVIPLDIGTSRFDFTMSMERTEQTIRGFVEFNTDLFDATTSERLLTHYCNLLETLVVAPETPIDIVGFLSKAEWQQLLIDWNQTATSFSDIQCIHELVAIHAQQTPHATALSCETHTLSYAALERRANHLANYLQSSEVGPEVVVAVYLERSIDLVVSLLAILKAGGAYLPIDPDYPTDRIAYMIQDSLARVVITNQVLVQQLPEHVDVCCIEGLVVPTNQNYQTALKSSVVPANPAYIIYTSGSTGTPKGVVVSHAALYNLIRWHQRAFGVATTDRATMLAGIGFDASVWEIWPYLTCGASVHIPDEDARSHPALLRDWFTKYQISIGFVPTPLMETVLPLDWSSDSALRALLTGGDQLHHYPADDCHFALINNYGPTENAVVATSGQVPSTQIINDLPSIGRPIDNVQSYVLDRHGQPVPIGVAGELYIGGASLARGYWYRPALTAERFVPDALSGMAGGRLYRTGDLVRYRSDGTIEFLGRIDQQVKMRGFRIELGEIEFVLRQHPSIHESVVVLREDKRDEKILVAYIVSADQQAPSNDTLRAFLGARLPDYMVPTAYVFLDALPLTANGKIDRKALTLSELIRSDAEHTFVAPRTSIEKTMASIWATVLGLEQVGIHENFFALGGDSIISIQLVDRSAQAKLYFTPKDVFQYPTIADLASVVSTTSSLHVPQETITGAVPLTAVQRWFFEQELPNPHHWNQAVLLMVDQRLDMDCLTQAIQHLTIHHDALRLRFTQADTGWTQFNASSDINNAFICSRVDLTNVSDSDLVKAITDAATTAQQSLNITSGPLVCVVWMDCGPMRTGRLLLVIHHLAVDGVSWRILLDDLYSTYAQLLAHQIPQLPFKTTSFQQWSQVIAEYAHSGQLATERTFWLTQPWDQCQPLPRDADGVNREADVQSMVLSLSVDETQALLYEVPQAYHTQITDVLLTALVRAITPWSGNANLPITLEGHGREDLFADVDLSRTIGWFTTLFPILLTNSTDMSIDEALVSVKEYLRHIPQHGIGYGLLRDICSDAAIRKLPTPEVSFNYLGQYDQVVSNAAIFGLAQESVGPIHGPAGLRAHLIDVITHVAQGQIHVVWEYSTAVHKPSTIEMLVQSYMTELRTIIDHCQNPDAGGYTPSDFPLAELDNDDFDTLSTLLGQVENR